eukprot:COSAG01_NODE_2293_length_7967_cov_83.137646_7_plen_62_part_00
MIHPRAVFPRNLGGTQRSFLSTMQRPRTVVCVCVGVVVIAVVVDAAGGFWRRLTRQTCVFR